MDSPSSIEDSLTEKMIPHYSSLDSFGAMKVYQLVNLESIRSQLATAFSVKTIPYPP
ncbi:unnamed protein product [Brassica oleracea]